jgi:hypothetical protein
MATRTIVTSQPDVACDVCGRRLLRGEQTDVFIAAGRRRIVCELCAPRAAHEGWLRETDAQPVALPSLRPRRGRSLFERFRARAADEAPLLEGDETAASDGDSDGDGDGDGAGGGAGVDAAADERQPYGFADSAPVPAARQSAVRAEGQPEGQPQERARERPSTYVEQAVAVFNASEFPRRVAGVARSLGAPAVSVRSAEHLSSVVSIVVAWELCWYRYEVDLSEPGAEAQAIGQGTELAELSREDRLANAAALESGALALSLAQ